MRRPASSDQRGSAHAYPPPQGARFPGQTRSASCHSLPHSHSRRPRSVLTRQPPNPDGGGPGMRRVRSTYGQFMIVEALLLAAITACVVPGMNFAARTHDLRTHSVPAAGAGLVIGTNHQNKTPYYVVFFHTQNGRQAEARIYDWPGASMPTRGDQVPIRYAPSD